MSPSQRRLVSDGGSTRIDDLAMCGKMTLSSPRGCGAVDVLLNCSPLRSEAAVRQARRIDLDLLESSLYVRRKDFLRMFDHYVSLGNNCEVAFQIRRVLGRDSSSFFSWNVTPLPSLVSLLQSDFANVLQFEHLKNEPQRGLIYNDFHNFRMHSRFKTDDIATEENFESEFKAFTEKMTYLIGKFKETAAGDDKVVYFYKTEEDEKVAEHAARVRDLLHERHGNPSFALVIIRSEAKKAPDVDGNGIFYRYLKRIAPWADATDGHVQSWDRIFREFPHAGGLRLAGY